MNVLVIYATAHGSTRGIAEHIADRLVASGCEAHAVEIHDRPDPAGADVVVLGSAVHNGRWLPEAQRFAEDHEAVLADRTTWLFSVCSIGDDGSFFPTRVGRWVASRRTDAKDLTALRAAIRPRDHRYFAGAIERDHWSTVGNLALRLFGGRFGDHRNWADIDTWADRIARGSTPDPSGV